jgi:hypothetical protein
MGQAKPRRQLLGRTGGPPTTASRRGTCSVRPPASNPSRGHGYHVQHELDEGGRRAPLLRPLCVSQGEAPQGQVDTLRGAWSENDLTGLAGEVRGDGFACSIGDSGGLGPQAALGGRGSRNNEGAAATWTVASSTSGAKRAVAAAA